MKYFPYIRYIEQNSDYLEKEEMIPTTALDFCLEELPRRER